MLIAHAKRNYDDGHYEQAKNMLLQLVCSYNHADQNYGSICTKIADCCCKLHQLDEARKYINKALNTESLHPKTILQIGDLLHVELNDLIEAERVYAIHKTLKPDDALCMFKCAKLEESKGNITMSFKMYKQCSEKTDKACLKFHLARIRMKLPGYDVEAGETMLQQLLFREPKIARYQMLAAKHMMQTEQYNKAKMKCLHASYLMNHQDPEIINQYNELSAKLQQLRQYNVKLVLYQFESVISYASVEQTTNNNRGRKSLCNTQDVKAR